MYFMRFLGTNAKLILRRKRYNTKRWLRKKRRDLRQIFSLQILFRRQKLWHKQSIDRFTNLRKKIEDRTDKIPRMHITNAPSTHLKHNIFRMGIGHRKKTVKIDYICSFENILIFDFSYIDSKCDPECGNITTAILPLVIHKHTLKNTFITNLKGH